MDTPIEILRILSYLVSMLLLVGLVLAVICFGLSVVGFYEGVVWIRSQLANREPGARGRWRGFRAWVKS